MTPAAVCPQNWFTGFDARIRKGTENFSQPLQNQRAIVTPLVLVIVGNEFADSFPILFFDLNKEVRAVQPDLAFRLPKSDQVNPHDQGNDQPRVNSVPKSYRHPKR
jgi:hypothetical protein